MIELFKKAKTGKIQVFHIWQEGADVVCEYGEYGGKMQTSRVTCIGKNLGKVNETTPEEQAAKEVLSKINQKLDKGYFRSSTEAEEETVFLPMLACPFEKRVGKLEYPLYVQPKFDGVRCLAYFANGWKLMSRGGKPYDVQHIITALANFGDPALVYDGELYIHGLPLQDIVSLVKKPKEGSEKIEYHIYDWFEKENLDKIWELRLRKLRRMAQQFPLHTNIRFVETQLIHEAALPSVHASYIQEGFEGTILRESKGTYELGKRSRHLVKYKDFQDAEFTVIGFTEGVGKFKHCVIWICETDEGKQFNVVPKGTIEQKREWFRTGDEFLGKKLTVKFQAWTNDRIPQFPVGITFRDYE